MDSNDIYSLADEFKTYYDVNTELTRAKKVNDARLSEARKKLIDALLGADSVMLNRNGYTFGVQQKIKYYISADIRDEAYPVLRECGLGDLIQEKVSDTELTAEIKRILEAGDGEKPEYAGLFDAIKKHEDLGISVRKDRKKINK